MLWLWYVECVRVYIKATNSGTQHQPTIIINIKSHKGKRHTKKVSESERTEKNEENMSALAPRPKPKRGK